MVPDKVPRLRLRKMLVENGVQAARLVDVAVYAVLDSLGRVAREMVRLPLHGAEAGVLEEEPVVDLVGFAGALRIRDFVVWVILVREVLEDAAGFEEVDCLAVFEGVC